MSFNVNQRSDGVRYDYSNLHPSYVSCEYIIYLKHDCGSIGDDVSFKTGGGRHSDGSRPNCYIANLPSEGGSGIRLRFEADHPNGYSTLFSGPGSATASLTSASTGQWVGFSGIKRNMNGFILIQAWQDTGNNEGATPANQWKCVGSWDARSPYHPTPPNDHQETWRIDGESCMEYKWNSLRNINPNDTTTPGTGGTGGGVGGGGFGGTTGSGQVGGGQIGGGQTVGNGSFDQMGNYVGAGSGTYDQYGNYVGYGSGSTGGGGSTGTGSGGTGTGIDTPSGSETQVVYERKEFFMRYNINFISGDACGVGKSPETRPLKSIYEVGGDVYAEGKHYKKFGIYVASESKTDPTKNSMFLNQIIRYMQFVAKRQGTTPLTGNINLKIRDVDYNEVANLGSIDSTIVTNSDQNLPFPNFTNNIRRIKKGDHISVEYDGSTQTDFLRVKVSQKDKIDLNNTILFVWDGNAYIYDPFADLAGAVSV